MSYDLTCRGSGRCDCCPGYEDQGLCDNLSLQRLKEVCVGYDTCADGAIFPYPYSCLYYGSRGCAMAVLDQGVRLPVPLLLGFLDQTEQAFPWWDEEAHAASFVAKLSPEAIQQLRGRIRLDCDFTLVVLPTYPIVRARLCFWPSTTEPLPIEALFDIGVKDHARALTHLSKQTSFHVHLHRNDTLSYVYSKLCPLEPDDRQGIDTTVWEAQQHLAAIPPHRLNFQRAKHIFHTVMGG